MADALVEMVPADAMPYSPSSTTDTSGNAVMMTYGFPGAPVGKYKIVVRKTVEDDLVYGTDEYGEKAVVSSTRYTLIEAQYSDKNKTPHEIEVTADSKGTKVTVDVGGAVRNKIE